MKFQNPSLIFLTVDERTTTRTSRKQYAPHFFKVGGIKIILARSKIIHTRIPFLYICRIVARSVFPNCDHILGLTNVMEKRLFLVPGIYFRLSFCIDQASCC